MLCTGKASVLLKQCGSHSLSLVLPIVKSLGLTLRRRRPLLPGSCSLSYTGEFYFFFHPFLILMLFVGFSLNDMMTVAADDSDDDDDDDDDDDEETASG